MDIENNNYYDSLLDDPVDVTNQDPATTDPDDNVEPFLPAQPSDEDDPNNNQPDNPDNPDNPDQPSEDDLITSYLKSRGIVDPSKIKFENDEGAVEEIDFNTLSKEEQLTMLQDLASSDYTDYERSVIDYIRGTGMDLQGIINYFQQKAIDDYLKENPDKVREQKYDIDEYSDDDLYISDLKLKFPEFSEEELKSKLDSAKLNEELFNKEVTALREYYKKEEEREKQEAELAEQQEYEQLKNTLLDAASRFTEVRLDSSDPNDLSGFEIEEEDRQKALNYLLAVDTNNVSQFDKDLSDPKALFRLAYFMTSGRDLIDQTSQYYKKLLADTRKDLAKAKKDLEKYTKTNDVKNNVTVKEPQTPRTANAKTIYDLWG